MITSDSYLNIMYLKMVSMGAIAIAIAIARSQPHGLLFNPMPNTRSARVNSSPAFPMTCCHY